MKVINGCSIILLLAVAVNVYAYQESHDIKLKGFSYPDGRFIKRVDLQSNQSDTKCWDDWTLSFEQTSITGTHTKQYYICTNALGTQCELLGTDVYTVTKQGNDYYVNPQKYILDISNVSSHYPGCRT